MRKTFWIPCEAAALMGAVTLGAYILISKLLPDAIATILSLGIAVAVYGVALIKFGALSPEEVQALPKGNSIYRLFVKLRLMQQV